MELTQFRFVSRQLATRKWKLVVLKIGLSIQNFVSLIPTDSNLTMINEKIVRGSGPITDTEGIWDALTSQSMTAYDRQIVLTEVKSLLAAAKPGFTQIQQDALSKCITDETNSLGPTPNY